MSVRWQQAAGGGAVPWAQPSASTFVGTLGQGGGVSLGMGGVVCLQLGQQWLVRV